MAAESESNEFAFGEDEVGTCKCPAVTAGFETFGGPTGKMAGLFDRAVCSGLHEDGSSASKGTIPEEKACKYWYEAIEYVENHASYADDVAKRGRDIAAELGWDEQMEADE